MTFDLDYKKRASLVGLLSLYVASWASRLAVGFSLRELSLRVLTQG